MVFITNLIYETAGTGCEKTQWAQRKRLTFPFFAKNVYPVPAKVYAFTRVLAARAVMVLWHSI
jgi:hypothetical protein